VLLDEVLVGELLAIDGFATSALIQSERTARRYWVKYALTLPRVKSPPWSMNSGMMRWKEEPL
jgi:hypothetical protein